MVWLLSGFLWPLAWKTQLRSSGITFDDDESIQMCCHKAQVPRVSMQQIFHAQAKVLNNRIYIINNSIQLQQQLT
jgi:hypothetical protein